MRTMGVKGLTLFHLKSHLQKYRLGKQSGKDFCETPKEGISASYLLESPGTSNSSPSMPTSDMNEGYEVKEALRAQMEVQSKLHLQVEAERHLQIRQDAERRYIEMLERACKMLADQFIGAGDVRGQTLEGPKGTRTKTSSPLLTPSTNVTGLYSLHLSSGDDAITVRADCSTESCLTTHESASPVAVGGDNRRTVSLLDSTTASLIWGDVKIRTRDVNESYGFTSYGI